jgi:hypothetical protein
MERVRMTGKADAPERTLSEDHVTPATLAEADERLRDAEVRIVALEQELALRDGECDAKRDIIAALEQERKELREEAASAWRIINRSQDDRLEDAGKYVGGIIAEQREATRLREAIREEVERLRDGTYINMELDEIADRIERRLTEGKNDDER